MKKDKISTKETNKIKKTVVSDSEKGVVNPTKKSDVKKTQNANAQKVSKEKPKSEVKYHYSVNLNTNQPAEAKQSVEQKKSKVSQTKAEEKKINFVEETEAVRVAETAKPEEVKHIKYSDKNKVALGSVLGAQSESEDGQPPSKLAKIKNSIDEIKNDPDSFKELQNFVKPPLLLKVKNALAKRASLKYWTLTLMGIMKAIDLFISFVIMPRGEGRNQALQKARSPILFGLWVFFIFFIVGGFWAGFAPLDKAVQAQGFIVTDRKSVV